MNNGDTNINDKDTNNGLYMNYNSYEPWHCKVISQNSYRRYIRNKIIERLENWKNTKNNNSLEQQNIATIFCRILYAGLQGETVIKNLVRKLKRHIDKLFTLKNIYRTKN